MSTKNSLGHEYDWVGYISSLLREFELKFATMNYLFCKTGKNRQKQTKPIRMICWLNFAAVKSVNFVFDPFWRSVNIMVFPPPPNQLMRRNVTDLKRDSDLFLKNARSL